MILGRRAVQLARPNAPQLADFVFGSHYLSQPLSVLRTLSSTHCAMDLDSDSDVENARAVFADVVFVDLGTGGAEVENLLAAKKQTYQEGRAWYVSDRSPRWPQVRVVDGPSSPMDPELRALAEVPDQEEEVAPVGETDRSRLGAMQVAVESTLVWNEDLGKYEKVARDNGVMALIARVRSKNAALGDDDFVRAARRPKPLRREGSLLNSSSSKNDDASRGLVGPEDVRKILKKNKAGVVTDPAALIEKVHGHFCLVRDTLGPAFWIVRLLVVRLIYVVEPGVEFMVLEREGEIPMFLFRSEEDQAWRWLSGDRIMNGVGLAGIRALGLHAYGTKNYG